MVKRGSAQALPLIIYICSMIPIERVYTTVKDISNKEQKGFITPAVFNTFANIAQLNIYNDLHKDLIEAKKLSKQGLDPANQDSLKKQVREDLSVFLIAANIENNASVPSNFDRLYYVTSGGNICEFESDAVRFHHMKYSLLSGGTSDHPICNIRNSTFFILNNSNNLDPAYESATNVMYYYRVPARPEYAYVSVNNNGYSIEQFNPINSVNFELPAKYENRVTAEILKMIGVRLRDNSISQYGMAEEASE